MKTAFESQSTKQKNKKNIGSWEFPNTNKIILHIFENLEVGLVMVFKIVLSRDTHRGAY